MSIMNSYEKHPPDRVKYRNKYISICNNQTHSILYTNTINFLLKGKSLFHSSDLPNV